MGINLSISRVNFADIQSMKHFQAEMQLSEADSSGEYLLESFLSPEKSTYKDDPGTIQSS